MQHTKHRPIQDEDDVSLLNILKFLSFNSKFLGLTTLILSAIAIPLSLLSPKPYQKQLVLSITPSPIPLSVQLPVMDVNQAGNLAVEFLQNPQIDQVTTEPHYSAENQRIDLKLQSPNPDSLKNTGTKIVSQLKTSFQEPLSQTLQTGLTSTKIQLERQQKVLAQLEQQIAKFPSTDRSIQEALQAQRAQSVAIVAALEFDQDYLENSQKNIADFTAQAISVKLLSESDVQPTSAPKQLAVVALLASFMVAVLAAIVRDQVARLKDDPYQNEN